MDCPLTYNAVPASANESAAACNGHGLPVYAQGTCQCYTGYDGAACGTCADGYALASNGLCQRTISSFQSEAALAGRNAFLLPAAAPAPAPALVPKVLVYLALPMGARNSFCTFYFCILMVD